MNNRISRFFNDPEPRKPKATDKDGLPIVHIFTEECSVLIAWDCLCDRAKQHGLVSEHEYTEEWVGYDEDYARELYVRLEAFAKQEKEAGTFYAEDDIDDPSYIAALVWSLIEQMATIDKELNDGE